MAHQNAKIKMGYYPLADQYALQIAQMFQKNQLDGGRILDICAGEGLALKVLSDTMELDAFGVELDIKRSQSATKLTANEKPMRIITDDVLKARIRPRESFSVVYANPPYDEEWEQDGFSKRKVRLEQRFLRHGWEFVTMGGYLITVMYLHNITEGVLIDMVKYADQMDIYHIPEKDMGKYYYIIGVSRRGFTTNEQREQLVTTWKERITMALSQLQMNSAVTTLTPLEEANSQVYVLPDEYEDEAFTKFSFRPNRITPEYFKANTDACSIKHETVPIHFWDRPAKREDLSPIIRQKSRQLTMVAATGLFNGMIFNVDGQRCIIRAISKKVAIVVDEQKDSNENITEQIIQHMRKPAITLLFEDGTIQDITEDDKLAQFISQHSQELFEEMYRRTRPLYNFDFIDGKFQPYIDSVRLTKGGQQHEFYPAQKHIVAAIVNAMAAGRKNINFVGEMGVGKTAMATAIADVFRWRPEGDAIREILESSDIHTRMREDQFIVVMCPPHLVGKWVDEIKGMFPKTLVHGIESGDDRDGPTAVKDWLNAVAQATPQTLKILVLSREKAKLGETWEPGTQQQRVRKKQMFGEAPVIPVCPQCGRQLKYRLSSGEERVVAPAKLMNNRLYCYNHILSGSQERGVRKAKMRFEGYGKPEDFDVEALTAKYTKYNYKEPRKEAEGDVKEMVHRARMTRRKHDAWHGCGSALWQEGRSYSSANLDAGEVLASKIAQGRSAHNTTAYVGSTRPAFQSTSRGYRQVHYIVQPVDPVKRMIPYPDLIIDTIKDIETIRAKRNPRAGLGGLAQLLVKYAGDQIFMTIFDEVHELKSTDSAQGIAFSRLTNASQYTLNLTGTLYGGVASSLYLIEFLTSEKVRREYPWGSEGLNKWIEHMGVLEEIIKTSTGKGKGRSSERKESRNFKEAAGASPELLALLLDHTLFLDMLDLRDHMPEFDEYPVEVVLNDDMVAQYEALDSDLIEYMIAQRALGNGSFGGSYYAAQMNAWDTLARDVAEKSFIDEEIDFQAVNGYPVIHRTREQDPQTGEISVAKSLVTYIPSLDTDYLSPKEELLIELVREEVSEGRGCAVFIRQTGKRPLPDRIERILKENIEGVKPFVLTASVSTKTREKRLKKEFAKGVNVLICNPRLVSTGLDLVETPTLIFFGIHESLYIMEQAAHRGWRPHQTLPCKNYYLFNSLGVGHQPTMEHRAIIAMAEKRMAANTLYGRGEGAVSALAGSSTGSLMKDVLRGLENVDSELPDATALFRQLRDQINEKDETEQITVGNYGTENTLQLEPVGAGDTLEGVAPIQITAKPLARKPRQQPEKESAKPLPAIKPVQTVVETPVLTSERLKIIQSLVEMRGKNLEYFINGGSSWKEYAEHLAKSNKKDEEIAFAIIEAMTPTQMKLF